MKPVASLTTRHPILAQNANAPLPSPQPTPQSHFLRAGNRRRLFGWIYAAANWQPDPSALDLDSLAGSADWIDIVAGLIEDAIQIFQEITG